MPTPAVFLSGLSAYEWYERNAFHLAQSPADLSKYDIDEKGHVKVYAGELVCRAEIDGHGRLCRWVFKRRDGLRKHVKSKHNLTIQEASAAVRQQEASVFYRDLQQYHELTTESLATTPSFHPPPKRSISLSAEERAPKRKQESPTENAVEPGEATIAHGQHDNSNDTIYPLQQKITTANELAQALSSQAQTVEWLAGKLEASQGSKEFKTLMGSVVEKMRCSSAELTHLTWELSCVVSQAATGEGSLFVDGKKEELEERSEVGGEEEEDMGLGEEEEDADVGAEREESVKAMEAVDEGEEPGLVACPFKYDSESEEE